MSKTYESITPALREAMLAQHVFFVATAPLAADGHVNLSPRGLSGTFAVLDEHRVAWLDLTGSGVETIAHLRENGRVTLMFCMFQGPANIIRLHGSGVVVTPDDDGWADLRARFADLPGARAVIVVSVERVSDSCGFAVPLMEYAGDRELLLSWAARKGPEALVDYRAQRNATSIDGLPGY